MDNDDKEGVDDDDNEDNNADVASNADNHLVPLTAGSEPLQAQSGNWQLGGQLLEGLQSFQNAIITDHHIYLLRANLLEFPAKGFRLRTHKLSKLHYISRNP